MLLTSRVWSYSLLFLIIFPISIHTILMKLKSQLITSFSFPSLLGFYWNQIKFV